jgi:hypothetical protein
MARGSCLVLYVFIRLPPQLLLLLRDNFIFDLVISALRHHLFLHKFVLSFVRPVHDDLEGVGVADARKGFQLFL